MDYNENLNNNKNQLDYKIFEKEVNLLLNQFHLIQLNDENILKCKKLYNRGYTVSDVISYFIMEN